MSRKEQLETLARQLADEGDYAGAKRVLAELDALAGEDPGFWEGTMQAIGNIPGSAAQLVSDLLAPIHSPIQTVTGLRDLAVGVYNKFTPGVQPEEMNVDALADFFKQRYGGWDETLKTMREDPVGFVGDIATVLGVGSAALPGKAGKLASTAASAVDPLTAATRGGARAAAALTPESMPASMYTKAAKFSTVAGDAERAKLVDAALQEQLMPTSQGLAQAYTRSAALSEEVGRVIDTAVAQGGTRIHKDRLFQAIDDLRKERGGVNLYATQDLKAIDRIAKNFDNHLKQTGQTYLTPREVQDFKIRTQNEVNYGRKDPRKGPTSEMAERAFARSAREALEETLPEVADLNERLARLRNLVGRPRDPGPLAKAAARIDQRNIAGLGLPMDIMTGQDVLGGLGAAAGAVKGIMELPKVRSSLALDLHRLKNPDLDLPPRYKSRTRRATEQFMTNPVLHGIMFQSGRYGEDIAP